MCTQKTRISFVKQCFTNYTQFASFRRTAKNSQTTWPFESICAEFYSFTDIKTTTTIEKYVPILIPISSNLIQEPIFFCDPNLFDLLSRFIDALENLAFQSKTQLKLNFLQIVTAENGLAGILKILNQGGNHCVGVDAEDNNSENS